MEKTVIFLSLLSLFFQSLPMDHRVAMKKMHEQYEQPESYKADDRPVLDGEPRLTHRQNLILACAGSSGWGKKFVGLALCTMLVCAEAAPIFSPTEPDYRTLQAHENDEMSPEKYSTSHCHANATKPNSLRCRGAINDYGVLLIAKANPDLVSIDLNGCHWVTYDGLEVLAKLCKKLRKIKLYDMLSTWDDDRSSIGPYDFEMRKFEKKYPHIEVAMRRKWEIEHERRQKEREAAYEHYLAARREEEQRRKKSIRDVIGDDKGL